MAVPDHKTIFAPELTAAYRRIWTIVDEVMEANKHAWFSTMGGTSLSPASACSPRRGRAPPPY